METSSTMLEQYYIFLILLCTMTVHFVVIVRAVNAGCDCIIFEETFGKEFGVFTSPNWPVPYVDNINCLLYSFLGDSNQIVEITFDEFDVQKTSVDCEYGDFVKLFLHLEDPGVNEKTQWNSILCGKIADIEQTHYSSNSNLIFEFRSDWRNGNNTGFRGTYRFLNKQLFQTDAELIQKTRCDYNFVSTATTNGTQRLRGRFYSPQYPSTYPKNVLCTYKFVGQPQERVKIILEEIRLQKSDLSCINSPDVILVHDGNSTSDPMIGQLCNINNYIELVSTGPTLLIQFVSRSHMPGQGFKGKYIFDTIVNSANSAAVAPDIPSTQPDVNNGKMPFEPTRLPAIQCDQTFESWVSKNGTFTSPNYPNPYPANVHCRYQFNGQGKERVQILFTDFELYRPDESGRDCDTADIVMVFITINGQKERVDNFCGTDLPPQLMSNGPSLSAEFKSHHSTDYVKGFRAIYRFVTNFGISTGKQDSQSVCGFVFNSTERTNGSFTSPNYPGLYPRDTECHYFFYGNTSQKIHITFAYFDVEGVTPCTTETASDYVEFSNYRTVDRKLSRHCGLKQPKTVESEGDFFRVTFKTNDRFDGTGFEAFYQFRSIEDPFHVKPMRTSSASVSDPSLQLPVLSMALIAISKRYSFS